MWVDFAARSMSILAAATTPMSSVSLAASVNEDEHDTLEMWVDSAEIPRSTLSPPQRRRFCHNGWRLLQHAETKKKKRTPELRLDAYVDSVSHSEAHILILVVGVCFLAQRS
ncbi:unnamed protein product [Linum trigynum]|uniref:Secreted protein n=1 Tax=Linum trigynum TaxID=586398 RepID=A0AAV2DQ13_9ROSI